MRHAWLMLVLVGAAACARASGGQSDAAPGDTVIVDGAVDANNCSSQPCSILPQCGCGGANACDIDVSDNKGTTCRAVATPGTETAACNGVTQCDKGYVCLGGSAFASCKKYCTADADCGSPRGACVIDITANGTPLMGIPSVCSSNCDPQSTNSPECPSTYKCGLFNATHNGTQVRIADCSPAGTGTQGASCASGTMGADNLCAKGYLCSTITTDTAFKCRRICKPNEVPTGCGAAQCLKFNPVFTIGTPPVEYGICN
ncbi:MAG TPA: hypothetical protein VMZ53_20745 [Kofleriaceae bacterium]|nr:hypothetical protein [Kofleriaceae bacterium]